MGYTVHGVTKESDTTQRQHTRMHGLGIRDTAEARDVDPPFIGGYTIGMSQLKEKTRRVGTQL